MIPNSEIVSILLLAFDKLRSLIQDYADSNNADISEFTEALSRLAEEHLNPDQKNSTQETVTIAIPQWQQSDHAAPSSTCSRPAAAARPFM